MSGNKPDISEVSDDEAINFWSQLLDKIRNYYDHAVCDGDVITITSDDNHIIVELDHIKKEISVSVEWGGVFKQFHPYPEKPHVYRLMKDEMGSLYLSIYIADEEVRFSVDQAAHWFVESDE